MNISEARHIANEKYNAKAYDTLLIRVPKGQKDIIKNAAENSGESVNSFIVRLINTEMDKISLP